MDAIIDENKKSWLQRFILWREKKIKEKHFIPVSYTHLTLPTNREV